MARLRRGLLFTAGPLAQQFVVLTHALLDSGSVGAVLERVVHAARDIVPGADLVSVTLRSVDRFHTPVETDRVARELDQLQYELGEGACVEAARVPGPGMAATDDLVSDVRWPRFGPAAAARGFRSLVSTALLPDATSPQLSGALNVYSRRAGGIAAADRNVLLLLATHASLALATTRAVTRGELMVEQLRAAFDSRDAIGQAKGILMARRGIDAEGPSRCCARRPRTSTSSCGIWRTPSPRIPTRSTLPAEADTVARLALRMCGNRSAGPIC